MAEPTPAKRQQFYTPQVLWRLFLIGALLPHFWTLMMVLRDFGWLTARSNAWDALGVGAYALLYALLDSLLLFLLLLVLSPLLPSAWGYKKALLLSAAALLASSWGLLGQLYFTLEVQFPAAFITWLANAAHPLRLLYLLILLLVAATIVVAFSLLLFCPKAADRFQSLLNPLTTLSFVYLCLDLGALIVVLVRNLLL